MIGRIVEIAQDHRHLRVDRGFLIVQDVALQTDIGRIPLDDVSALIANAHGLTYTHNVLVALAERCAPFVVCSSNHNVTAMLWPVDGNYQQARRFDAQLAASAPTRKRLWAEIVRAKLRQQAAVLTAIGAPSAPLSALVQKVRSGDTSNVEAQGARRYWRLLFGESFRRDSDGDGVNALLNYGYTVLRAATARAVVAAGLHPTLGLHHSNEANAMRLVDDLMEPFRPLVDFCVWKIQSEGPPSMSSDSKRALVNVLYEDMRGTAGTTPTTVCMQRLAVSLAQVYLRERNELDLPFPGLPIEMAAGIKKM